AVSRFATRFRHEQARVACGAEKGSLIAYDGRVVIRAHRVVRTQAQAVESVSDQRRNTLSRRGQSAQRALCARTPRIDEDREPIRPIGAISDDGVDPLFERTQGIAAIERDLFQQRVGKRVQKNVGQARKLYLDLVSAGVVLSPLA